MPAHLSEDQAEGQATPSRAKALKATSLSRAATWSAPCLVAVLVLGGCAVGPKFVTPKAPVKQEWSESANPMIAIGTKPDSAWWTVFGDTTLNRLVGLAHQRNLSLQMMGLRIMAARAQLAVAVGRQYPQVQALVGSAMALQNSENTPIGKAFDRNHADFQLGFDVAWEADFWGKYRYDVQAQTAGFLSNLSEYDNALVSLTAEVARTYSLIRTFEALIEEARRNVKLQEDGLKITEARFKNGATSELDVSQATALLQGTLTTIPQLEISLAQAQNAMSTLIGQPAGSAQALLQGSKGIPVAPAKISIIVPVQLLQRRPDIKSAEYLAAAQCARVGIAKSERYPSFILTGSVGLQSSAGIDGVSSNLFDPASIFYAIGPRMMWPILNYGRLANAVKVQDARLQEALVNYQNTVLRAVQEVEDGLVGYLKSQEAAVFAANAVKASQHSVELSMIQYREGAVGYERVLEAQSTLLQDVNTLTQTRSAIATNLVSLYKATGGGWETRKGKPVVADSTLDEMQRRTNWGKMLETPTAPAGSDPTTPKDR